MVGTWSSITLRALVNLRQIKENQEKNWVILKCTLCSLISIPSHPSGVAPLNHMLESSTNSHSQHHILGSGSWHQSGSDYCQVLGKGNRVRNPIHFLHPTATFTKFLPVKPVLLKTHLPAPGSWSNSFFSSAIPRAWDIFSGSSFGGNSDLGSMGGVI